MTGESYEPVAGTHRAVDVPSPFPLDVWWLRSSDTSADELARAGEWLSAEEHQRYRRYLTAEKQREYLLTRCLVRMVLSRYADVAPHAWSFAVDRFGKPHVAAPITSSDLRFSVSHSGGMIVCAVARGIDVGVDVEDIERPLEYRQAARLVFTPAELEQFESLPEPMARRRCFQIWTSKEAYSKAYGRGFGIPFDQFTVDLAAAPAVAIRFTSLWRIVTQCHFYDPKHGFYLSYAQARGLRQTNSAQS